MERPFDIFPATTIVACTFDQHKLNLFSMNLKTISLDLLPLSQLNLTIVAQEVFPHRQPPNHRVFQQNNLPFGHPLPADLHDRPQVGHSSAEDSCFVRNHGEKETKLFGPIFSHWIGLDDDIDQTGSRHDRWFSLCAWHLLLFLSGSERWSVLLKLVTEFDWERSFLDRNSFWSL